jgi:iron complex outermembrane receptor protein
MTMNRKSVTVLLASLVIAAPARGQQTDSTKPSQKRPTRLTELVTTATRTSQAVSSSPLAITALTRADLATSSAPSVPNLLWRIPGFTMRDYQSSLFSNTARGVPGFRGLNGSTAGRTLVLLDGVPLNESFSGRLNWSRIPLSLVDRVEVVRGGGSMLWGSRALGGVINVLTANPARTSLTLVGEGGVYGTYRGAMAASLRDQKLSVSLATDWSGTDGVILLRKDQVGPVDIPNGGKDRVIFGKLAYDFTPGLRAYLSGNYMRASGTGSTAINVSAQNIGELRGGFRFTTLQQGVLEVAGYANRFRARTLTSSVSSDRTSATPSRDTHIPAHSAGASIQWSQTALSRHHLTAGFDISRTSGQLAEDANYSGGRMTLERTIAGKQVLAGAFLQDNFVFANRWRLLAGFRVDGVRNYDGRRIDTDLIAQSALRDTTYPRRNFTRLNYSLGVRHSASDALDWRASLYGAFRAPTLYELYQTNYSNRGGVTAANPDLLPERLFGAELGADLNFGEALLVRATVFWNRVHDPIVDYTIGTATTSGQQIEPCGSLPKDQVCRQRRNVDALRTMGLEAELEYHPTQTWSLWTSYTFNPTRISAPGQEVDGMIARGAARHAASAVVTYDNPALVSVTLEQRYVASRSDDDLNTIRLESFMVTGVRMTRRLWRQSSVYLKVDNLFNSDYPISRATNGLEEIAAPRWVTLGLRASW